LGAIGIVVAWVKGWIAKIPGPWPWPKKQPARPGAAIPLPSDAPPPAGTTLERERDQLREALYHYNEAVQALEALLGCSHGERDQFAREWFDGLANYLETSLRTSTSERYRASIWASRGDKDNFDAVGLGKFNPNDDRMRTLSRTRTIGGDAFVNGNGFKYCPDIHDAECGWIPRRSKNPEYKSLLALALTAVDGETRWGALTIDCNLEDGFSELDQQIARHFAELASFGELIWRRKGTTFARNRRNVTRI
jgi:hypothetical protein